MTITQGVGTVCLVLAAIDIVVAAFWLWNAPPGRRGRIVLTVAFSAGLLLLIAVILFGKLPMV